MPKNLKRGDRKCSDFLYPELLFIRNFRNLLCPVGGSFLTSTLFSLGFPVVGDKLYGLDDHIFDRFSDERMTDDDRKTLVIERQALHALRLKMTSPFDGKEMIFDAGLPEEFSVLEKQFSLV